MMVDSDHTMSRLRQYLSKMDGKSIAGQLGRMAWIREVLADWYYVDPEGAQIGLDYFQSHFQSMGADEQFGLHFDLADDTLRGPHSLLADEIHPLFEYTTVLTLGSHGGRFPDWQIDLFKEGRFHEIFPRVQSSHYDVNQTGFRTHFLYYLAHSWGEQLTSFCLIKTGIWKNEDQWRMQWQVRKKTQRTYLEIESLDHMSIWDSDSKRALQNKDSKVYYRPKPRTPKTKPVSAPANPPAQEENGA